MAISKVIYKASASATPEVWMDATPATAAAADILAPKTAMLADGVVTTGTGTGGGGGAVERKDVNFIDSYDGTIAYSYTTAEFAALTALPANPSHTGMTAQGWNMPSNWTISDAKTYISTNKRYDWGQMYTTDDGKTRVYIHLEEGRTSPMLGCCPNGTVDVDWGDGTTHDTLTGTSVSTVKWTPTHNYSAPGDYVIKLTVTGSMGLYGYSNSNQYSGLLRYASGADIRNRHYQCAIRRIEIGNNVTRIGDYALEYCHRLTSITIPSGVTYMGSNAFYQCYNLMSLTIPSGVTSISSNTSYNCYSLTSITIPIGVTSIGGSAFQNCYILISPTIPSGVTSIGNSAFSYCISFTHITIPSGVTSIGSSTFSNCYSITSMTIPSGVTSINTTAFQNGYGLSSLHFKSETPPTVAGSNTFTSLPTDCTIYVPTGSKSAYTSATNYPSSSTYTYVEE